MSMLPLLRRPRRHTSHPTTTTNSSNKTVDATIPKSITTTSNNSMVFRRILLRYKYVWMLAGVLVLILLAAGLGLVLVPFKNTTKTMTSTQETKKFIPASRNPHNANQLIERPPAKLLKVPYPIVVLNLPKTGTTAIWKYFECGLERDDIAVHWWHDGHPMGPCLQRNLRRHKNPFHNCGTFDVWIDCGYADGISSGHCFFPSIHGLESIFEYYPHATMMYIRRHPYDWLHSVKQWGGGKLLDRWTASCLDSFFPNQTQATKTPKDPQDHGRRNHNNHTSTRSPPPVTISDADWISFYHWHEDRIRQFATLHPSMTYIEPPNDMTLESQQLGAWLQEHIGIDATCWSHCRPNGTQATCVNG